MIAHTITSAVAKTNVAGRPAKLDSLLENLENQLLFMLASQSVVPASVRLMAHGSAANPKRASAVPAQTAPAASTAREVASLPGP
ncbi:hypothetical protein PT2222_150277 [Paraburkholderia tropica]